MSKGNMPPRLGLFALVIGITLGLLFVSVTIVESIVFPDLSETQYESKTIWQDGISYYPRQDISVFLLMGIDRSGPVADSGSYKNSGAADMVTLLVFNHTDKIYRVLTINRDSMVEMPVLGLNGKQAGSVVGQLALSHTYGNGLQESCENTAYTVSKLLSGTYIDYYISMNMDVVSILTNAVDGVKVNVRDNFSAVDDTIPKGEVILSGEQAYKFVRTRKGVEDQLNLSRMDRQTEYMEGFIEAFRSNVGNNARKVLDIYESVSPYIVTNCSKQIVLDLLNRLYDYSLAEVLTLPGTNVRGDEFMEFHLDDQELNSLILKLFYSQKHK